MEEKEKPQDAIQDDSNVPEVKGAFIDSLVRNNRKIREDRAQAIFEDAELIFKRKVEDLQVKLNRLKRSRENMLDLSPNSATSLIVAADFDAEAYVNKDMELGIEIRNTEIELDIAKRRYAYLFGKEL